MGEEEHMEIIGDTDRFQIIQHSLDTILQISDLPYFAFFVGPNPLKSPKDS